VIFTPAADDPEVRACVNISIIQIMTETESSIVYVLSNETDTVEWRVLEQ